jgi:hypothetical protein
LIAVIHQRNLPFQRDFQFTRIVRKCNSEVGGNLVFEYHAPRVESADGVKRAVLVIPGVTGDIYEGYIKATMEAASL